MPVITASLAGTTTVADARSGFARSRRTHLEVRRVLVRDQIQRAADQRGIGHLVVEARDALPCRNSVGNRCPARDEQIELALVAVADDADHVRGSRRGRHERNGQRIRDEVGARRRGRGSRGPFRDPCRARARRRGSSDTCRTSAHRREASAGGCREAVRLVPRGRAELRRDRSRRPFPFPSRRRSHAARSLRSRQAICRRRGSGCRTTARSSRSRSARRLSPSIASGSTSNRSLPLRPTRT